MKNLFFYTLIPVVILLSSTNFTVRHISETGTEKEISTHTQKNSLAPIPNDAVYVSHTAPSNLIPGETVSVSVSMKNTGSNPWTFLGDYKLGFDEKLPDGVTPVWGHTRVYLSSGESVAPGSTKTFTFDITAPTTPGTYNFEWGMVQENIEWFGTKSPNDPIIVQEAIQTTFPYIESDINISPATVPGDYSPYEYSSGSIDISSVYGVTISMDIEGVDANTLEDTDYLNIYYRINGGDLQVISENTDGFAKKTVSVSGISGDRIEIVVQSKISASDEAYNVTNIKIEEEIQATYNLTVNSGDGDGAYFQATEVNISADAAPSGQIFDKWIGDVSALEDIYNSATTLNMPPYSIEITAIYKNMPTYSLLVTSGIGSGNYPQDENVAIVAVKAPKGQEFDKWFVVSGSVSIDNIYSETASLTMPANALEIIATYKNLEPSSVSDVNMDSEKNFGFDNYPNPFSLETNITYELSEDAEINISIYNIQGKQISTLVDDFFKAGAYSTVWTPEGNISRGVYLAVIRITNKNGSFIRSHKMNFVP